MYRRHILILTALLIAGAFMRIWQLHTIPPGLWPDEAMNGTNALEAIRTGDFQIFYPQNNGREALFINIQALSILLFGNTAWSLRIVSALFGSATILGIYFFVRELALMYPRFRRHAYAIALAGAFFLAFSFWHIMFSRIGFRAIMAPWCLSMGLASLLYAIRTEKPWGYALSGFFLGLGMHTYIAYRAVPVIYLTLFTLALLAHGKQFRSFTTGIKTFVRTHLSSWVLLGATACVVILPLAVYFWLHPGTFLGRAGDVAISSSAHPLRDLAFSTAKTLGMFNVWGDNNWRHNLSGRPQLSLPVGILFLIGLALILRDGWRAIKKRKWNAAYAPLTLGTTFAVLLVPSLASKEGLPHALRAIAVIPAVYALAAFGLAWMGLTMAAWYRQAKRARRELIVLLALILAAIAVNDVTTYFARWGRHVEVKKAFIDRTSEIARILNALPPDIKRHVIIDDPGIEARDLHLNDTVNSPVFLQPLIYLTAYHPEIRYLLLDDVLVHTPFAPSVYVVLGENQSAFDDFRDNFPWGETVEIGEIDVVVYNGQ